MRSVASDEDVTERKFYLAEVLGCSQSIRGSVKRRQGCSQDLCLGGATINQGMKMYESGQMLS